MKFAMIAILSTALAAAALGDGQNNFAIIPQPQKVAPLPGTFTLTPRTRITFRGEGSDAEALRLAALLSQPTGYNIRISPTATKRRGANEITLQSGTGGPDLVTGGPEAYELTVSNTGVTIVANTDAGLFYGAETLMQLLPPEIFSSNVVANRTWQIPCVSIQDWPRFQWRGLMLDVSRHFYDKEEVEKILDDMALHKLNVFHWHLTDDQGWRIEIKKYPKLTEIGAWRQKSDLTSKGEDEDQNEKGNAHPDWAKVSSSKFASDGRYGGFYTQNDIQEIFAYALARHITIVPEIEMPGHEEAALAAYPQYGFAGINYTTDAPAGINNGVFDPSNPGTFKFLDDILSEVFRLFPEKYVHVGGDEVNKKVRAATWDKSPQCQALMKQEGLKNDEELQSWFTRQIQKHVNACGRTLVGWSEIAQGGLTAGAAVMDWKGGGLEAANAGHDVIMSPTRFCYFDYYQLKDHSIQPPAIGGFLPLEKVYSFEPVPAQLPPNEQSHILGGQGNLWTEYVASLPHAEYMIFPRACALAEVLWSPKESRDYADFVRRLQVHVKRLDELGINYCHEFATAPASTPGPSPSP